MRNTGIWCRRLRVASSPVQVRRPVAPISATERTPPKNAPLQIATASASRPTGTWRMRLSAAMREISGAIQSSGSDAAIRILHFVSCSCSRAVTSIVTLSGTADDALSWRRSNDFDFDQKFRPGKTADNHQRRGRRRVADIAIAHAHIALEMLAGDDERIDADDVTEAQACLIEHCADIAKAEIGLLFDGGGDLIVCRDSQLAGADQDAVTGGNFYAVTVAREGRANAWRGDVFHASRRPGRSTGLRSPMRRRLCYSMQPG